jgi:hypothetical protein
MALSRQFSRPNEAEHHLTIDLEPSQTSSVEFSSTQNRVAWPMHFVLPNRLHGLMVMEQLLSAVVSE